MSDTLIFRTKRLYEADMVVSALEDVDIPCYRRSEVGNVQTAMPLAPADWLGQSWCVFVPEEIADKAKKIIDSIPFTQESEHEHIETPESARTHRIIVFVFLAIIVLIICLALAM
jgi:Putative prokaryotic signal transducing protein